MPHRVWLPSTVSNEQLKRSWPEGGAVFVVEGIGEDADVVDVEGTVVVVEVRGMVVVVDVEGMVVVVEVKGMVVVVEVEGMVVVVDVEGMVVVVDVEGMVVVVEVEDVVVVVDVEDMVVDVAATVVEVVGVDGSAVEVVDKGDFVEDAGMVVVPFCLHGPEVTKMLSKAISPAYSSPLVPTNATCK